MRRGSTVAVAGRGGGGGGGRKERGRRGEQIHVIGGCSSLAQPTDDGNFQSHRRSISAGFQLAALSTCPLPTLSITLPYQETRRHAAYPLLPTAHTYTRDYSLTTRLLTQIADPHRHRALQESMLLLLLLPRRRDGNQRGIHRRLLRPVARPRTAHVDGRYP